MYTRKSLWVLYLLISSQARAVGPYHTPCEEKESASDEALSLLKTCLDQSTYRQQNDVDGASGICKPENQRFQNAMEKLRKCRSGAETAPTNPSKEDHT